jgi:hypothetical protein
MGTILSGRLRQRAEYTHKQNLKTGRHGWLRLTPAYSVMMVEELIAQCDRPMRIFDPFSGTATTALCAAYHGHDAVTIDINPFLVWLGRAKTACYLQKTLASAAVACTEVIKLVNTKRVHPVTAPPIHNIERWWPPAELEFLCTLRSAIDATTPTASPQRTLLLVAFCRTLIALSNAAFNHQSMGFKDNAQMPLALNIDLGGKYLNDVEFVLSGAADNPKGTTEVILGDSRNPWCVEGVFDRVITSPPYVNRMSYIRELRPYMYWLSFLSNGRDAGELDWSAIGGTWGIATSRLAEWKPDGTLFSHQVLDHAVNKIAHHCNKSGDVLSKYVLKYFGDMWVHFQGLPHMLAPQGEIHYIVGNSTFYDVLLPVEQIYASMLRQLGFKNIRCLPIRKRNSKKELVEFDVTAAWPG